LRGLAKSRITGAQLSTILAIEFIALVRKKKTANLHWTDRESQIIKIFKVIHNCDDLDANIIVCKLQDYPPADILQKWNELFSLLQPPPAASTAVAYTASGSGISAAYGATNPVSSNATVPIGEQEHERGSSTQNLEKEKPHGDDSEFHELSELLREFSKLFGTQEYSAHDESLDIV
jgi:hypothetical protein